MIQRDLPEVSRASAFGRSETALQLSWVFGGVIGLLIGGVWKFGSASVYAIGFGVVTLILGLGLAQCLLVRTGAHHGAECAVPAPRPRRRAGRAGGRPGRDHSPAGRTRATSGGRGRPHRNRPDATADATANGR